MAAYTPTTYVNGQAPAINATDLNHLTAELVLQAADLNINTSTFLTPTYWVNGSTHAISDPTGLNEMERIISLVAAHFSLQYTPTTWQTGWVPARNATRLNNMELQTQTNRAQLDLPPPGQVPTAPTGLVVTPGDHQLTLTWAANPSGDNVDSWQIYENNNWFDNSWITRPITPRSYVMTTDATGAPLVPGNSYNVRVGAHNSAGYGPYGAAVAGVPTGVQPPPGNRYTNVDFSTGLYWGQGVTEVFEAYQSDARLATWGGREAYIYDNPGAYGLSPATSMSTDLAQRTHLFHPTSVGLPANPTGSAWASWQELRTTDGPWEITLQPPNQLAKATLNTDHPGQAATWGPAGFSFGAIRWWACDILYPFNISGASSLAGAVSYQSFTSEWSTHFDMHDSGGTGSVPFYVGEYPGGGGDTFMVFRTTPNQASNGVPYYTVNLMPLWSGGSRVGSSFNTWHEVVIGEKVTADNTGWFEVWFDGVQVQPQTPRQVVTSAEAGPYIQLQNYSRYPTTYAGGATRSAIVYGGFRAGLARTDVQTR